MTLPAGFTIRVRDDVQYLDGGRYLLGGSPLKGIKLSQAGADLVADRQFTVIDARTEALASRLLAADVAQPVFNDRAAAADLTVIIPVKDRPRSLERTLYVLNQGYRTIVVDDGSDDPSAIIALADMYGAEYLRLAVNQGPAAARNAGLEHVMSSLVAFVDSDVRVSTAQLTHLSDHFADERVALVAPRVRGVIVSERPRWYEHYDADHSSLDLGGRSGLVRPGSAIPYVPSACLVGRTSVLKPGFDESLQLGEDVDLVWRLVRDGHHIRYEARTVVRHEVRASWQDWLGRKVLYGTSAAELAQRHGDAVAPAVLRPAVAGAAAALMVRRRWSVPVALALMAPAARRVHRQVPDARTSRRLIAQAIRDGIGQESSLLLRHWWPVSLVAAGSSRTGRRVLASALIWKTATSWTSTSPGNVTRDIAGGYLDDVAYGLGLLRGSLSRRSVRSLLPKIQIRDDGR